MDKKELRSQVKQRLHEWRASCWIPVVTEGAGAATSSKFAGIPALKKGEDWPRCGQCKDPMPLFVQLNLEEIPASSKQSKDTRGIIQLFFCTKNDCDTSCDAKKPAFLARLIKATELGDLATALKKPVTTLCPEKVIVGWRQREDYPPFEADVELSDEELNVIWSEYDKENGFPRPGDKLLGWPNWVQGENYPSCPVCGEDMFCNIFQVDSQDNLPFAFGDMGNGHIFLCPKHPDQVTFTWASY